MIIIVLASAAFWLSWFFVCTKAVWTFHTPEKMKDTFGQSWNNTIHKKKTLVLVLQKKWKKKEKRNARNVQIIWCTRLRTICI